MTREELEVWERYSAACLVGLMDLRSQYRNGGVVDYCKDAAEYADQMLIEWRKRRGTDSPYRD